MAYKVKMVNKVHLIKEDGNRIGMVNIINIINPISHEGSGKTCLLFLNKH